MTKTWAWAKARLGPEYCLSNRVMDLWGQYDSAKNERVQVAYRIARHRFGVKIKDTFRVRKDGVHEQFLTLHATLRGHTLVCVSEYRRRKVVFALPAERMANIRRVAIPMGRSLE